MRYYVPRLQIATLTEEQKKLVSKIGGLPWGLPAERWPVCCGKPQKLLAQLVHEPPMLDLGAPGSVLHLFQCLECCGIDDCGRDAFVVDQSQLGDSLTWIPGCDVPADLGSELIGEFRSAGWAEYDDGIPEARQPEFFDEAKLWKLQEEFPHIDWFHCRARTKFGGSPRWTGNGPLDFPAPPFEFLFQLDEYLFLDGPAPGPNEAGCLVTKFRGEGKPSEVARPDAGMSRINAPWGIMYDEGSAAYHYAEYTNLGSDGTLYVFVDRSKKPHEFVWYWNR